MEIPQKWLHIGTNEIKVEKFRAIQNDPILPKPAGGLWASPFYLNGEYYSDWQRFSEEIWGKKPKEKAVVFEFKKNARIYVIDVQNDLIDLIEEVGVAKSPIPYFHKLFIDFEKAKEVYDVIYLTKEGQQRTRIPLTRTEYNLYGWDCESCIILNPHVIGKQMPIVIHH